MKYPKTLFLRRGPDKNDPKASYYETVGTTIEQCAEVDQVVEVAIYEFKRTVKVKTVVAVLLER